MTFPGANTSILAHPSNVGVGVNHPKVVVLHTPEEPADNYVSTPRWFAQAHPGKEGSTHYFISWVGEVWLCVPEEKRAIANGVTADRPYPAGTDPSVSLNLQSISVEIEGYAATIGQTISKAQHKALVEWVAYCCRKYDIPVLRSRIIGHYEVASNRSDPGTLNIDLVVKDVRTLMEGDMTPEQDARMRRIEKELADIHQWLFDAGWVVKPPPDVPDNNAGFVAKHAIINNGH